MATLLHRFFEDTRVQIALLLIGLDFVLGVVASVVKGNFNLTFVSDFLRNDVLAKVLPFFVLYGGYVYAKEANVVIPGVDMEVLMNGAWVILTGAMVGSLLNSLKDLGLLSALPAALAGDDPRTPPRPPANAPR